MELSKHRFEFFSDGTMAIIMTIMVLEIPIPSPLSLDGLFELLRSLLIFFVSFFIVAGFLHKHHHLVDNIAKITGRIIWRNFLFLFFIALLPVFTKLVIENSDSSIAVIAYDTVFLLANMSFILLFREARGQIPQEMRERRNGKHKNAKHKFMFLGLAMAWIIMLGMIVMSIIFPKFSIVMYIAFPVALNFTNIFREGNFNRRQRQ